MDGLNYNCVRKPSDKWMEEKLIGAVEYKHVDTARRLYLGVLGKSVSYRLQGVAEIYQRKNRSVSDSLL